MSFTYHQPQFAMLSAATILPARAGYKIRGYAYGMFGAGKFQTSTGPADITGVLGAAGTTSQNAADQRAGLFETAYGDGLVFNGAGTGYVAAVYVRDTGTEANKN